MNTNDYKKILNSPEYEFLKTNEHLGDNIILLALGGSHAYGTNTHTSDLDIRGIAIEKPENLIGYQNFEQVINEATDTTIYAFNKIIHLLTDANPNIIEILGLEEDQYLYMTPLGRELIANKDLFLSQKIFYTFGGYAKANLKRLENALARDNYPEDRKNEHIAQSLENAIADFNSKHDSEICTSFASDKDGNLVYNVNLKDFPAEDFEQFYATVSNTNRNYRELLNRNRKKDDAHLNKHAMHLVRLYLMCIEMLNTGVIRTKRVEDHDLLMDIRNGKYMGEDGNMTPAFYTMISELETRCKEALEHTSLPKKPRVKEIEKFVMEVNKKIINGDYSTNKFTI